MKLRALLLLMIIAIFTACTIENEPNQEEDKMVEKIANEQTITLKSELEAKKSAFEQKATDEKKRVYGEGIKAVEESGILESALNVGDKAPNFTLENATGKQISLYEELENGAVILTWYRGGWCPYCNITLKHLQDMLPKFKLADANLIALTPELPDKSLSTKEKNELEFEVLSDVGNKIGKEYGVVFNLTDEVAASYQKSFDLHGYKGDESDELPLGATYVIDRNGIIRYAFLDADYRNRAEPQEVLEAVKGL